MYCPSHAADVLARLQVDRKPAGTAGGAGSCAVAVGATVGGRSVGVAVGRGLGVAVAVAAGEGDTVGVGRVGLGIGVAVSSTVGEAVAVGDGELVGAANVRDGAAVAPGDGGVAVAETVAGAVAVAVSLPVPAGDPSSCIVANTTSTVTGTTARSTRNAVTTSERAALPVGSF